MDSGRSSQSSCFAGSLVGSFACNGLSGVPILSGCGCHRSSMSSNYFNGIYIFPNIWATFLLLCCNALSLLQRWVSGASSESDSAGALAASSHIKQSNDAFVHAFKIEAGSTAAGAASGKAWDGRVVSGSALLGCFRSPAFQAEDSLIACGMDAYGIMCLLAGANVACRMSACS